MPRSNRVTRIKTRQISYCAGAWRVNLSLQKLPRSIVHARAAGVNSFRCLLDRHMKRHFRGPSLRTRPSDRVVNDALNLGVVINGIKFVARAEVKDPPAAAGPAIAAAENFSALEPRNEDLFIRRRNAER